MDLSFGPPPLLDGDEREIRCIIRGTSDDSTSIGLNVVAPIGDGASDHLRREVVIFDLDGCAILGGTWVLTAAHFYLLFVVNAYH